tara:strand:+ start:1152 stop:2516 length:1365 start_codon:yes stop_codon:yes gene_type:complete
MAFNVFGDNSVTSAALDDNAITSAKIAASNVTLAKIENLADQRILGNVGGSAAAPSALTATQVRTLINVEDGADVTDTANVTSAGALMDTECSSLADVKALNQSVISGASPTFGTGNMTDATNKRFMTDAQETKLDSVETNADVTDTANVKSALGAAMPSDALTIGDSDTTVTIAGNLTVSGTTTTVNSTTINLNDHNITLDSSNDGSALVDGAGITISGGSADDLTFQYLLSSDRMELKKGSSFADLKAGTFTGALSGNATTASTLATARNIGGVSFDGSANIDLPGVNTAGSQNTTGNAATATKLATAVTIGGVSFDGSTAINLPGVNQAGTQNTSGTSGGVAGGVSLVNGSGTVFSMFLGDLITSATNSETKANVIYNIDANFVLPEPVSNGSGPGHTGAVKFIRNSHASATRTITVDGSSKKINGESSFDLPAGASAICVSDGSDGWLIF